jgi:hypothetical protein
MEMFLDFDPCDACPISPQCDKVRCLIEEGDDGDGDEE